METIDVAIVATDDAIRLAAARAFDAAPPHWRVALCDRVPEDADVVVVGPELEIAGAVHFDPLEPERVIAAVGDALAAQQPGAGGLHRRIVVTGAGGGTGATTLALHLAQELARNAAVCFVDLDQRWGAASRLGFERSNARTWGGVGGATADEIRLAALPFAGGFSVLLAPEGDEPDHVPEILRTVSSEFAWAVIDVPRGPLLEPALDNADLALLVVPPSSPGARRAGELLPRMNLTRSAIVLNRTGPGGETTRVGVERILGRNVALDLPCCARLRDVEDEPRLFSSSLSAWSRGIRRLARHLQQP